MEENPYETPRGEDENHRRSNRRFLFPSLLGIFVVAFVLGDFFAPADPVSVVIATGMLLVFGLTAFGLGVFVGR